VRLLLLGDGARKAELKADAARRCLDNVVFVDTVPKEMVARYWSLLDVSIIHLRRTELFTTVIPSKLFECMGMGIPVLHGVAGESADIVRREGCGDVFEPEDVDALVDTLLTLRRDTARIARYRQACLAGASNYDRRILGLRMLEVLERVASHGR
jgi:glycosyltransferase involved in cell wall biosynthesis